LLRLVVAEFEGSSFPNEGLVALGQCPVTVLHGLVALGQCPAAGLRGLVKILGHPVALLKEAAVLVIPIGDRGIDRDENVVVQG
jgi:hypothetical protein